MKKYVVGFAFNDNHVLLIEKKRPDWQKGFFNGIGGHIEGDELPINAMVRKFEEECGISTTESDWEEFATMKGGDWICYCFRSRNRFDLALSKQTTDEKPEIVNAYTIYQYATISNLPGLIGLAMDDNALIHATLNY